LSQFKKYHPFGNLNFNNLGIFQFLKLRLLAEKILPNPLNFNFTPNTLLWAKLSPVLACGTWE